MYKSSKLLTVNSCYLQKLYHPLKAKALGSCRKNTIDRIKNTTDRLESNLDAYN